MNTGTARRPSSVCISARSKQKGLSKIETLGAFVFGLIVIAWLAVHALGIKPISDDAHGSAAQSKSVTASAQSVTPPTNIPPSVITATPVGLYQAYATNEIATNNQLQGKVVQVTGPVASIDEDVWGHPALSFSTGFGNIPMQAELYDSEKQAAASLHPGQTVTIQCTSMTRIIGSPVGTDCKIIPSSTTAAQPGAGNSTG